MFKWSNAYGTSWKFYIIYMKFDHIRLEEFFVNTNYTSKEKGPLFSFDNIIGTLENIRVVWKSYEVKFKRLLFILTSLEDNKIEIQVFKYKIK